MKIKTTMKKSKLPLLLFCCILFSCSNSPEEYFNRAVLNSNTIYGFAGDGMHRELESPSVKLIDEKKGTTAPMTRTEVIQNKIKTVETNFEKVKNLSVTDETKEMLTASIAMYEYILPVYKNEYQQLALLYDNGAAPEKIEAAEKNIHDKYAEKFLLLHNEVLTAGKGYATKNGIRVMEVNPSPTNY